MRAWLLFALALQILIPSITTADDWPQWNGPTRDGVAHVQGIIRDIPANGLPLAWKTDAGLGYSGPAVANGLVYLFDYVLESGSVTNNPGKRDQLEGRERLRCFDERSGKLQWTKDYDRPYAVSYGAGPRATPTVYNGLVYVLGAEGDLQCYDAKSGEPKWSRNFSKDYGAKTPIWGHAASPLVYKSTLICMVGGEGSLVVAFDLLTGQERWKALTAKETGYCPPSLHSHAGIEHLLIWDPERLHSLNPANGKPHWQQPLKPNYGMSILPPVTEGPLLFAGGEGSVGAMYQLGANGDAEVKWKGTPRTGLYLATSAAVFDNGYLYGADIRSGALVCARASDGKRMWQTAKPTTGDDRGRGAAHGSAFLIKLRDRYLILSETGDLISAKLTPEKYEETGRFHAIDPTGKSMGRDYLWTFPAIANGKLFVRNDRELICYDIREKSE